MSLNEQNQNLEERRAAPRVPYQVGLWFSTFDGENVPADDEFQQAETRNLSAMGVSFFCDRSLEPQQPVVLRLGSYDCPIYLTGVIIHCQHDRWGSENDYFVGCRFCGRVQE